LAGTVGATTGTYARGLPTTTVYTSVTRSRYSNVVNTANQILGARNELMYERYCVTRGFFYGAGMDVWTNGGAFCWAHSNYSTALLLKNTVGFCIDAGDLEQWFFNKRNRCYKSGYWVIC
jgi:hypothetical protein